MGQGNLDLRGNKITDLGISVLEDEGMGTGIGKKRWIAVLSVMGMTALPVALGVGLIDIPTAHAKGGDGGGGGGSGGSGGGGEAAGATVVEVAAPAVSGGSGGSSGGKGGSSGGNGGGHSSNSSNSKLKLRWRRAEFRKPERQRL